jgi:glycosyltransferase involved in cell wall biosynthesis
MSTPVLSVVIPTRNRRETLMTALRALGRQREIGGRLEVVVVDDGSTDGTGGLVRGSIFEAFDLQVLTVDAGGPARARNRGIAAAQSKRVLLLGDDTIPAPLALSAHLTAAAGREIAVQGRIDWDPDEEVTDVMAFLAPEGPQFWFRGLTDRRPVPWTQVLGSNLSAPTEWFRTEPFDERFTDASMEDTELAWRWRKRGWSAVWSEGALCHHHHRYDDIDPFLDRQYRTGRWARMAVAMHWGMGFKLLVEPLLATAWKRVKNARWSMVGRSRARDRWDLQCRMAYLAGFFGRRPPS